MNFYYKFLDSAQSFEISDCILVKNDSLIKGLTPQMKVLMFDWEFPPHISSGLGIACHGFAQASATEKVEIQLVVTPLGGGAQMKHSRYLNGSLSPDQTLALSKSSLKVHIGTHFQKNILLKRLVEKNKNPLP